MIYNNCVVLGNEIIIFLLLELQLDNNFRKKLLHLDQRTARTKELYTTRIKELLYLDIYINL